MAKRGTVNEHGIMSGFLGNLSQEQEEFLELLQTELRQEYEDEEFRGMVEESYKSFVEDKAYVLRYLRARKWDRKKAREQFINAMKWRKDFGVEKFKEEDISLALQEAGAFYFVNGYDKMNRPVSVIHVRNHTRKNYNLDDIKKFSIFMMELGRQFMLPGVETVCILFDLTDFAAKHMDLAFVQFLVSSLEKYYPESLGVCLVYNAPWIFNPFWRIIRPLLDEVVAEKVQFVKPDEVFDWIDRDNLPKILGGNLPDAVHPVVPSKAYKPFLDRARAARGEIVLNESPSSHAIESKKDDVDDDAPHSSSEDHASFGNFTPLELDPSDTVVLKRSINGSSSSSSSTTSLDVHNPNSFPLAFKFKTTAPKMITVKPSSGKLEPSESMVLTIEFAIKGELPDDYRNKDRLLCQSLPFISSDANEAVLDYWTRIEPSHKGQIAEQKIRVKLDTNVLRPITPTSEPSLPPTPQRADLPSPTTSVVGEVTDDKKKKGGFSKAARVLKRNMSFEALTRKKRSSSINNKSDSESNVASSSNKSLDRSGSVDSIDDVFDDPNEDANASRSVRTSTPATTPIAPSTTTTSTTTIAASAAERPLPVDSMTKAAEMMRELVTEVKQLRVAIVDLGRHTTTSKLLEKKTALGLFESTPSWLLALVGFASFVLGAWLL